MEYLIDIHDSLKMYDETNIQYINLFEHPELFYGTVNKNKYLNFNKFPPEVIEEVNNYSADAISEMNNYIKQKKGG